ncbi:hypothetical protein PV327_008822 [Microctonus hyperodae]|uniref:ADAMTS cysteine-rich domain-containing protein n=1 Tax=Microctonus hyperodae TaxID=165561 RepID=A0AA39FSH8_MICHY|nr:hypothetical protein PV327_008822 [Microctonus hyperodae]
MNPQAGPSTRPDSIQENSEFPTSFNNATDPESSRTSGRSKRSLADDMPRKLYITIENEMENKEKLIFVKTNQHVANSHLPVDAPANYLFRDTVMDDIGEFVMYQDLTTSSAIVYFGKLKAIFGVYRTNYYIEGYPLRWNCRGYSLGIVDSSYVVKRENIPFQVGPNVLSADHMNKDQGTYEMDQNNEQIMNPQAGPSTRPDSIQNYGDKTNIEWKKNQSPAIPYYLETLVFISKGVTDIYYQVFKDDHINEIVRYYLVYFNAVDLLYQKLDVPNVNIHINIAKIVFEDETVRPFDFINQGEIHFTELISKLPTYLKEYSSSYPPDSFDHVFIVTDSSSDIDLLEYKERLECSQNSLNQFEAFFRENPNRVFLRNKPRSLLPPGRHALISPEAQCRCLGYDYYKKGPSKSSLKIRKDECTKPLQCNKEGIEQLYSVPLWPFDGTKCGEFKVCWAGQCVLLM